MAAKCRFAAVIAAAATPSGGLPMATGGVLCAFDLIVSAEPITADEIIIFRCMPSPNDLSPVQLVHLNCLRVKRSTFDNSGRDSKREKKMLATSQRDTLPSRRVMSGDAQLAHFYYAFGIVFLWRCYYQILRPRCHLSEFINRLCGHRNARLCFDAHMTWQATNSYV
jgi:hypothetical protein